MGLFNSAKTVNEECAVGARLVRLVDDTQMADANLHALLSLAPHLAAVVASTMGCVALQRKTSIFLQSLVRNCPQADTTTQSLQSRTNTEPCDEI